MIVATRLRKGAVNSVRGAARLVTDVLVTARAAGASGLVVLRADSAFYAHACFTDSPLPMLDAEATHRGHAIVEQVIADLKDSALAHVPSGRFSANGAWLVCAAMLFNLTRAAGALASTFHAKARTATIRAQLIDVPARLARSARRLVLHLPRDWPWEAAWEQLFTAASTGPPRAA